jgi:hypothetical protein
MNKKFFIIPFITIFIIVFLSNGCKNGPTTISYGEPLISAELRKYDKLNAPEARVEVEGTELLPVVTINNDTLELYACDPKGEYMWESVFADEVSTDPDSEYELIVSHNGGEAHGTVKIPGDFEIASPEDEDTLYSNENLTVNWSPSENVERYELRITLNYIYGDTANPYYNRFSLDTLLSNSVTSLTIQKERVFPSEIGPIQEGNGYLYIYATNGPQIGMSAEGNIYGEGIGYFTAIYRRYVRFIIEDASN